MLKLEHGNLACAPDISPLPPTCVQQEINLSYGELDSDSGLAVVEALANKKVLKTLELNGKQLPPDHKFVEPLLRPPPPNKGHVGTNHFVHFVHYREVVLSLEGQDVLAQ